MRKLETNDLPLPLHFPSLTIPLSNTLRLYPPPLISKDNVRDLQETEATFITTLNPLPVGISSDVDIFLLITCY